MEGYAIIPLFLALNSMTYYYVSKNQRRRNFQLLKSRYSEDMIISEKDVISAHTYKGYTKEGYMYLNYYSNIGVFLVCATAAAIQIPHIVDTMQLMRCVLDVF